jgi:hypothetical protein
MATSSKTASAKEGSCHSMGGMGTDDAGARTLSHPESETMIPLSRRRLLGATVTESPIVLCKRRALSSWTQAITPVLKRKGVMLGHKQGIDAVKQKLVPCLEGYEMETLKLKHLNRDKKYQIFQLKRHLELQAGLVRKLRIEMEDITTPARPPQEPGSCKAAAINCMTPPYKYLH